MFEDAPSLSNIHRAREGRCAGTRTDRGRHSGVDTSGAEDAGRISHKKEACDENIEAIISTIADGGTA